MADPARFPIWMVKAACVSADVLTIGAALAVAHVVRLTLPGTDTSGLAGHHVTVVALSLPAWVLAFNKHRLYSARFIARRIDELMRLFQATLIGIVSVALISFTTQWTVARGWLVIGFFASVTFLAIERELVRRLFASLHRRGLMRRRVLIVGANLEGLQLCSGLLRQRSLGYEVLGFTDDALAPGETILGRWPVVAPVADTLKAAEALGASGVLIATTAVDVDTSNRLARELVVNGIHVELSSSLRDIDSLRLCVFPVGRFPMLYIQPISQSGWRPAAKRVIDILGASAGLLLTLPFLLVAAVALKLDSRGPVFFKQDRMGRKCRPFRCLKLRTMVADAEQLRAALSDRNEAAGGYFKITDDPRITRVGRFLRRTSMDEIPQLWNVLHGEMSLVGPRPLPLADVLAHGSPLTEQRMQVKPGITGLWQVSGRSTSEPEDYERLDIFYVENWSLLNDASILARTIPAVLFGRGAA